MYSNPFEFAGLVRSAGKAELIRLIDAGRTAPGPLMAAADAVRRGIYGDSVFFRGLIEFSNYCKNGCRYCGLSRVNKNLPRYRMTPDEITACCMDGYGRGFRSFVLQSGEDVWYSDELIIAAVMELKRLMPDAALTLSIGELAPEIYAKLHMAGVDRYLLRHETANAAHYTALHPPEMTLEARKACLTEIRSAGLAVGSGFMVGSPGQKSAYLAEDLLLLKELSPEMAGIGPFIPQEDTEYAGEMPGDLNLTLAMVALTRLILPYAMLPSTTALGVLQKGGRALGLKAGANVVMPNLTPAKYKEYYNLYDGKTSADNAAGAELDSIIQDVINAGYTPDFSRGDPAKYQKGTVYNEP